MLYSKNSVTVRVEPLSESGDAISCEQAGKFGLTLDHVALLTPVALFIQLSIPVHVQMRQLRFSKYVDIKILHSTISLISNILITYVLAF